MLDGQFRQLPKALLAVHRPGGVVGRADDDGLCPGGDGVLNRLQVQLVVVRPDRDKHRGCAGQADHLGIADPAGDGQNHLVPRPRNDHHGACNRLLGTHGGGDLVEAVFDSIVLLELLHDLLPQLQDAVARGIFGEVIRDGLHARHFDVIRRAKVRFPYVQGDDILPLLLELRHLRNQSRGGRPAEFAHPFRQCGCHV